MGVGMCTEFNASVYFSGLNFLQPFNTVFVHIRLKLVLLQLAHSMRRDCLPLAMLLILFPLTNVPAAVRVPHRALAIEFPKLPIANVLRAILKPSNTVTILTIILETTNIIIFCLIKVFDKEAL